eukprot:13286146-Alexandrium_andersonii.AAC.1
MPDWGLPPAHRSTFPAGLPFGGSSEATGVQSSCAGLRRSIAAEPFRDPRGLPQIVGLRKARAAQS